MPVRPAAAVIRRTHSQHGNKAKGRYRLAVAVRSFPRRQRAWPYGPSGRTHTREFPFPGAFFQMARHARRLRHVGLPPEGSPGSLSAPSGMQRPSAWRAFFVACGLPEGPDCVERILEAHAAVPARPMERRYVLPKLRHGTCLPDREIPGQETCRVVPHAGQPPDYPARSRHRTASPPQKPRAPSRRRPSSGTPDTLQPALPADRKQALRITSRRPSCTVSCSPVNARPRQLPCHRDEGPRPLPDVLQLPGTGQSPDTFCSSCIPSARPYGPAGQPPDKDGDCRPDLKKIFFGMGRAGEGKGQF